MSPIAERVHAGLARARQQGKRLGRRRSTPLPIAAPKGLTVRQAATLWGCNKSQAADASRGAKCHQWPSWRHEDRQDEEAGRPPAGIDGKPSSQYPQLAVRVPSETIRQVAEIAAARDGPQWQVVRDAVTRYHRHQVVRRKRR